MQLVSISLDVKERSHRNEEQLQYLTKMIYSQVHYTRQVTPWLYFKAQKQNKKLKTAMWKHAPKCETTENKNYLEKMEEHLYINLSKLKSSPTFRTSISN